MSEPLICSAGGIPYNKPHLDAKDTEIERLRTANYELKRERTRLIGELRKIRDAAHAATEQ